VGDANSILIDHYTHPRNVGILDEAHISAQAENAACGDELFLYAQIKNSCFSKVRFKAFGCAPAIAAGSVLTEKIKGMSLEDAAQISCDDIDLALGCLPPLKKHCAVLAEDALKALLRQAHL
jgi:NifU-like protein involved in Fe-S cluster formation